MKIAGPRLTLSRETLRNLDPQQLRAAGGATKTCGSTTCPQECGPTEVNSCTSCVCTI